MLRNASAVGNRGRLRKGLQSALRLAGNARASQEVLEGLSKGQLEDFVQTWGLKKAASGCWKLPKGIAASNPLLAVMWSRFQEGCRITRGLGESAHMARDDGFLARLRPLLSHLAAIALRLRASSEAVLSCGGHLQSRMKLLQEAARREHIMSQRTGCPRRIMSRTADAEVPRRAVRRGKRIFLQPGPLARCSARRLATAPTRHLQ